MIKELSRRNSRGVKIYDKLFRRYSKCYYEILLKRNMAYKIRFGSPGNRSFDRSSSPVNYFLISKNQSKTQPNQEKEMQEMLERYLSASSPKKDIVAEMHRKSRERELSAEKLQENTKMLKQRRDIKAKGLHLSQKELLSKQNKEKVPPNRPETNPAQLSVHYQQQLIKDERGIRKRAGSPQPKRAEPKTETLLEFKKKFAAFRPQSTNYSKRYMSQGVETPYMSELNTSQNVMIKTSLPQNNLLDLNSSVLIKQSADNLQEPESNRQVKVSDKRSNAEKIALLKSFKKFSEETHNRFTANVKSLARVARAVDGVQQDIYEKISKNKLLSKEYQNEEAEDSGEGSPGCYMQINYHFMEEMKKFLSEKARTAKNQEMMSKSSVQEYLLNMLTLHSSFMSGLTKDDQEDTAVVLHMLMKIHMLEFEDILFSYKINIDLGNKHKRNDGKEEKKMLNEQIAQQRSRFKNEISSYKRNLDVAEKRYERCLKDRQELERELMDRQYLLQQEQTSVSKGL